MNRRAFLRSAAAATAVTPWLRFGSRPQPLRANGARLNSWLARFDSIGRTPGGINRVAYSDADLAGRAFTLDLFREAGLNPGIDTAGNIRGLLPGTAPNLPLRLDVTVDHAVAVRIVERVRDLGRDLHGFVDAQLMLTIELVPERLAFDVRHDVVEECLAAGFGLSPCDRQGVL